MFHMFFVNFKIYENVIEIYDADVIHQVFHDFINKNLKNDRRIDQLERHDDVFEEFISRTKNDFSLVIFFDANSIINIFEI